MPGKTKILSGIAVLLLLLTLSAQGEIFGIPAALAQDNVVTDTQGNIMGGLLFAVGILNFLSFFCLKLLSYLVDPETVFGVSGGNAVMMLRLWQISRDIMNIIFAIMVLGGAIMTIVFGKQEVVKQHLVKFILAVILVNFSWFFPRVVFDVANVTTASIYGLPNLVNSKCKWIDKNGAGQDCVVVTDILFFEDATTGRCPTTTAPSNPAELDMRPIMKVCLGPLLPNTNTGFGILNGLVVNHGRLNYLGVIAGSPPSGGTGGTVAETLRFIIILVVVTFLHVMLVFPLAAMTAVMIIRIPILWLTVAFMPFMFIGFVIGEKFIGKNSMEIFTKHFVTAAFLPAIIAVPLSVGYIMLNEVARLHIAGVFTSPPELRSAVPFIPQAQNWWAVIWILLAFMIMWVGSRWAMKRDDIYARFTEPIFTMGNSFLKLPVTAPLIPHDTSGNGAIGPEDRKSSVADVFYNLQHNPIMPFGQPNTFRGPGGANTTEVGRNAPINANLNTSLSGLKGAFQEDQQSMQQLQQHIDTLTRAMSQNGVQTQSRSQAIQFIQGYNEKHNQGLSQTNINQISENLNKSGKFTQS